MKRGLGIVIAAILVIVLCVTVFLKPSPQTGLSGELKIIHAGSLSVPIKEASEVFMKKHPGVKVLTESHGSRTCARQISELGKEYDVFGSADYSVIDTLLIPQHASYTLRFATNEMAIVLAERAKKKITAETWCDILLDPEIKWGHSDPNQDPCGYRCLMTLQLAEKHYNKAGFYKNMLEHKGRVVRPKETDLLALIETGEIDYLFIYRSVAEQHKLDFITLPDEINLKNPAKSELYAQASVQLTGEKPGEFITKKGAPMVYGITIPGNAPNPPAALAFVELMLGPEGNKIMTSCGQGVIAPAICEQYDALPEELKKIAKPLPNEKHTR